MPEIAKGSNIWYEYIGEECGASTTSPPLAGERCFQNALARVTDENTGKEQYLCDRHFYEFCRQVEKDSTNA